MSKRRNRTPNIPEETLQRAREQASPLTGSTRDERRSAATGTRRRRSNTEGLAQGGLARRRADGEMSAAYVQELLANPTKIVSEAELRSQYTYVLADLRNMAVLSVFLIVALVVLAVFFV